MASLLSLTLQVKHLVDIVVRRIGLEIGDRFKADSRKVKFVVKGPLPPINAFPKFTDFDIVHHYLQVRLNVWMNKVTFIPHTENYRRAPEDCSLELGSVAAVMAADGLTP